MKGLWSLVRASWARLRSDQGSMVPEVAVIMPAVAIVIGLAIVAGRISVADGAIEQAARDAARSASITRDAGAAQSAAVAGARAVLDQQSLQCITLTVSVDTSGFARTIGAAAHVTAKVTCVADLRDLAVPGMPGTRTLTSTFASPIDPYRGTS